MITPLELVKRTAKSNCGECGYPTCLAFAALVVKGVADPQRCPYLDATGLDLPQTATVAADQLHQAQTQIDRQARTIARLEAGEHRFLCVGCGVAVWSRAQEPPPSWRPDPAQPERFRCQDCAARAAAASPATMGMQTPMPPLGYEG